VSATQLHKLHDNETIYTKNYWSSVKWTSYNMHIVVQFTYIQQLIKYFHIREMSMLNWKNMSLEPHILLHKNALNGIQVHGPHKRYVLGPNHCTVLNTTLLIGNSWTQERVKTVYTLKLYIITPTHAEVTNKIILVKDISYNLTSFGVLRHHHQGKT
jgi:hypothetical protein